MIIASESLEQIPRPAGNPPGRGLWLAIWACWLLGIACTGLLIVQGRLMSEQRYDRTQQGLPGCGPGEACETVLASPYAKVLGISLTKWAAGYYLAVGLALLVCLFGWRTALLAPPFSLCLPVVTSIGLVAAAWYVTIMLLAVRQVCLYCMLLHLANTVLFFLCLAYARIDWQFCQQRRWDAALPPLPSTPAAIHMLLAILIGTSQLLLMSLYHDPPAVAGTKFERSNRLGLRELSPGAVEKMAVDAAVAGGAATDAATLADEPTVWTVLGPRDAAHRLVVFSCPTCPLCGQLHHILKGLLARYPDQLRIDIRFVPLWYTCNERIGKRTTGSRHRDACELVRLVLGVAHAAPDKFPTYLDWMYSQGDTLSATLAEVEARARLDEDQWNAARDDEAVWQRFRADLKLSHQFNINSVPQMFLSVGQVYGGITSGNLERLLVETAGLTPPDAITDGGRQVWVAPRMILHKVKLGANLAQRGQYAEAVEAYRQVLQLRHEWPEISLRLSWILATCNDTGVRDGSQALHHARAARRLAQELRNTGKDEYEREFYRRNRGRIYDTLAAAYAESGDFESAQNAAKQALDYYQKDQLPEEAATAKQRMEQYQRHEPLRVN